MSDKNNKKKTKEDFTNFLLNDDLSLQKTTLLDHVQPQPAPVDASKKQEELSDKTENIQKNVEAKDGPNLDNKTTKTKELTKSHSIVEGVKSILGEKKEEPKVKSVESKSVESKNSTEQLNPFQKDKIDPSLFSLEAALKQAEYLKIAQKKVKELEGKICEITKENETLAASATVLQKKLDQAVGKIELIQSEHSDQVANFKDEIVLKEKIIRVLEKERDELQKKNEELKLLTNEKIQQIRIREKELENRLEILHLEGDVIVTNKDEIILGLKKQIDQLNYELDNFKAQARELNRDMQNQKDQMRRTIKALRLALGLLESQELDGSELKKTGS